MNVIKCPECGNKEYVKAGFIVRGRKKVQRYRCKNCHRYFDIKEEET